MYKYEAIKIADLIEKQMKGYIKMETIMDAQVYIELDKRGFNIDLISGSNNRVLVVIHRK